MTSQVIGIVYAIIKFDWSRWVKKYSQMLWSVNHHIKVDPAVFHVLLMKEVVWCLEEVSEEDITTKKFHGILQVHVRWSAHKQFICFDLGRVLDCCYIQLRRLGMGELAFYAPCLFTCTTAKLDFTFRFVTWILCEIHVFKEEFIPWLPSLFQCLLIEHCTLLAGIPFQWLLGGYWDY